MKLGIIMDSLSYINATKDSTLAMLIESQARDWQNYFMQSSDIWLQDGLIWGHMQPIEVNLENEIWYQLGEPVEQPLVELDAILMRKDPPFNMDYIYLTYLLEQAEAKGVLVLNKPSSLRDANEKLFATWFPQCCPKTLVTSEQHLLEEFVYSEAEVVVKPLGSMGGDSVFRLSDGDPNLAVILETMTRHETRLVMAQGFIPEIAQGDKRIIMINGEPIPYALARVPAAGDFRGNLASGAVAEGRELTDHDRWICEQVGPTLRDKGLIFVGLDVIGDYLTEINVTSPTGVRELDKIFGINICSHLMDYIADQVHAKH
ncbi:MAG: glutathione synthase [Gammaproteobacteria bacterium]|nr:glutathione synthase [Gammaproteobacteria bacterium]